MSERCAHEPYQGRCIHCDVPFVNGAPAMSERDEARKAGEKDADEIVAKHSGELRTALSIVNANHVDVWEQMVERGARAIYTDVDFADMADAKEVATACIRAALGISDE